MQGPHEASEKLVAVEIKRNPTLGEVAEASWEKIKW
jgi:hypothetical protein